MRRSILFVLSFFVLAGCSDGGTAKKVSDKDTTPDIKVIENVEPNMITHLYTADNMDRGNHDYYDKPLVIDSNITGSEITRGDVIFFEDQVNGKEVARVVALPGEKIMIKKGQIYIQDKLLDTFYGKAHRAGLDKETYLEKMEDSQGKDYDKKSATETFEVNMEEIELADGEYYVVSDDWLRGNRTVLKAEELLGKVIGYTDE